MEHVKLSLESYELLKADSVELAKMRDGENQAFSDLVQAMIDVAMVYGFMWRDYSTSSVGLPVVGDALAAMDAYNRHANSKFQIGLNGTKLEVTRKKQV